MDNWKTDLATFLDNVAMKDLNKLVEFEEKFCHLAKKPALVLISEFYMISNGILKSKLKFLN